MFSFLRSWFSRSAEQGKKEDQKKAAKKPDSIPAGIGRTTPKDDSADLLNPLNPLSPLNPASPLNPVNQANQDFNGAAPHHHSAPAAPAPDPAPQTHHHAPVHTPGPTPDFSSGHSHTPTFHHVDTGSFTSFHHH